MADKPAGKPAAPAAKPGAILVEIFIAVLVFLLIIPFIKLFSGVSTDSFGPVLSIVTVVYSFVALLATVVSMGAIVIIIYSYIRIEEINAEDNKKLGLDLSWESERNQKNGRWQRVEEYMTSLNPSDWKVGILEADNILDEITTRMGYAGSTLGERMKNIPASEFPYLEEAWEAHKIRNAVAHKGTDYALSRSDAEHVVNIYYRVFAALGYL